MRTAFIQKLIEEARLDQRIFLVTGDLGFSVLESFQKEFPDRFLNAGVAEQNMTGISAGLAMEGYTVYTYSIANFPTLRCIEQIRYDICYHNLNVKIVAIGGGYAYGSLGPSHHATEEIGMLRTIPNLIVCAPGDPLEAKAVASFSSRHSGPCYIRIGKAGEPFVHENDIELSIGDIVSVIETDSAIAVFSMGATLKHAFDFINQNELASSLYSFPFIKPINKATLLTLLQKYKKIITIEEHQAQGGFGSAILELINDLVDEGKLKVSPKIKRIAIPDQFYSIAGSQDYLRTLAGIELNASYWNTDLGD